MSEELSESQAMTDLVEKVQEAVDFAEEIGRYKYMSRDEAEEIIAIVLAEIKAKCPEIWPVIESRINAQ